MQHVKLHVNLQACWFENLLMYLWVYPTSNSWKLPEACLCTILAIGGRALKLGWSPERLSNLPDLFLYSNKKDESSLQTATSNECDAKSEKMRHLQLCRWVTTPRWCSSGTVLGALQPIWLLKTLEFNVCIDCMCIYTVKQISCFNSRVVPWLHGLLW